MDYLKTKYQSLMSAAPGTESVMRFAFINIIIMDYVILLIWFIFCVKTGKIVDIGSNIADFAGFINAAGFLGKAGQSYVENKRQSYAPTSSFSMSPTPNASKSEAG
jgi:hypothetical protein